MSITVVIADDHPFIVEGMISTIDLVPSLNVIGTAKNGIEAIALIKRLKPNCALLDLSMPGANGFEVFLEAKRWSPNTRFAIVTGRSASSLFKQLFDAGIDGLFVKNSDSQDISQGILRMAQGERVISAEAMTIIKTSEVNEKLSNRELEVMHGIARGERSSEIAVSLGISPKTVDSHRTNLLRKMEVNSTAALLVKAIRVGLLKV